MRALLLAGLSLGLSGCEAPCPGSSGSMSGTFQGASFSLTCFQAFLVNSGGESVQLTGTAGNDGTNGSELQMTFAVRSGCTFQSGQTVALADPCTVVQLAVPSVGGLASNLEGTAPLGSGGVPGPDTRGSFALSSWSIEAGTPIAVSFSADAQLTFDGQTPSGPVGIAGSASGQLIP